VGLLTGDLSINRDAPVVVMTTEIFRNMLYGTRIGETGTTLQQVRGRGARRVPLHERSPAGHRVGRVDHLLPSRDSAAGPVGHGGKQRSADGLAACQVHGPTELIYSTFRPVPLEFHYCTGKGPGAPADDPKRRCTPS
jgi:hypothetical protein